MIIWTTGLTDGMLVFMIASGLTLILGVMRVVNFAHGGFFLIGAYMAYQLMGGRIETTSLFILLLVAASLVTAAVGYASELALFRRLYHMPEINSLLGTYALLLVLEGGVQLIWGQDPLTQPQPVGLTRSIQVGAALIPRYSIVVLIAGIATLIILELVLNATRFGHQINAVAEDRYMAQLLGINVNWVFSATFALGTFLAGLGGGLAGPTLSMVPDIAVTFVLEAFAVVIIGGFGSILGSLIAALVLGVVHAYLVAFVPTLADFSLYFLMIVVLVVRPQGLFGAAALGAKKA
ncbi:MAG: branched-chain amino acid ABC transporter permease [Acetobacteraceae bacterium]